MQYKVISALYEQNLGCAQPLSDIQTATEVFKLEQELNLWRHCVAPPLCIRSHDTVNYDSEAACEERFSVVLTLRYLNLQTLLHRPFVAKSLDVRTGRGKGTGSTTSAERLASGSIQTCIKSAEEVISIVHAIISAKRAHDLLGAWWFSLYYGRPSRPSAYQIHTYVRVIVFGASLTIFGTLLISPDLAAIATPLPDRLEEGCLSLRKASDALRQLDVGNQVATRCADYLSEISSLLDRWRKYNPKQCTRRSCGIKSSNASRSPGSNSKSGDTAIGDVFRPQDILQSGGYSLPPFQGMGLDQSQMSSDAMFMNDFALNDLETGQFFLPDDFLQRAHPLKNKSAQ